MFNKSHFKADILNHCARHVITLLILWGTAFTLTLILFSCNMTDTKDITLEKVQVDSVKVVKSDAERGEVTLSIKGILPNPAYTFDHFDVKVAKNEVTVTPWALYDRNKIVIQVIVPFEEECEIKGLKKGRYELKVISRTGSIVQILDI